MNNKETHIPADSRRRGRVCVLPELGLDLLVVLLGLERGLKSLTNRWDRCSVFNNRCSLWNDSTSICWALLASCCCSRATWLAVRSWTSCSWRWSRSTSCSRRWTSGSVIATIVSRSAELQTTPASFIHLLTCVLVHVIFSNIFSVYIYVYIINIYKTNYIYMYTFTFNYIFNIFTFIFSTFYI